MQGVIGHAAILRELHALATSDDPPHALLFAGPEHTGRAALAREYARLLNCERRGAPVPRAQAGFGFELEGSDAGETGIPCGECRPCKLIAEGTHADVVTVTPGDMLCRPRAGDSSHPSHADSRDIRICQVRGTIDLVSRYPYEAAYRMVIIDPAERLTGEAANTLLKTLEEPPGHTIFGLVTAAPEAVPETVISRCRRIDVRPVARAEIVAGLSARGVAADLAESAAEAAHGKPGLAIACAADPDLIGSRGRILQRCARIAAARTTERFRYSQELTDRWRRDRAQVQNELDIWESFWEGQLQQAARDPSGPAAAVTPPLAALRAIASAREEILANVQAHLVFDLMLLSFPRLTLAAPPEEEPALNA